jgi:hypothetical protein
LAGETVGVTETADRVIAGIGWGEVVAGTTADTNVVLEIHESGACLAG